MYTELELRKPQASDYLEGYQNGGSEEQSRFTFQPWRQMSMCNWGGGTKKLSTFSHNRIWILGYSSINGLTTSVRKAIKPLPVRDQIFTESVTLQKKKKKRQAPKSLWFISCNNYWMRTSRFSSCQSLWLTLVLSFTLIPFMLIIVLRWPRSKWNELSIRSVLWV